MDTLILLTDRFPFGKGEAFIENEIPYLAERFKKIIVIPTALTADASIRRPLPSNAIVLPPANTDNLYENGRPTAKQRVVWSLKYMLPWCIAVFLRKEFYAEVFDLLRTHQFNIKRFAAIIRSLAPTIRNIHHFSALKGKAGIQDSDNVYIYSYWLNENITHVYEMLGIKKGNVKTIVARAHGFDLYSERRSCNYIPFQKKVLERIDALYLISQNGKEYITQKYPQFKEKYRLSYLGTRDYGIAPYAKDTIFHVVSCSYVIPVKRVHRIVEALSAITDKNIIWTHIGAGQDFDVLKDYSEEKLGSLQNIQCEFKGHILNQDLMKYYQNNSVSLFINVSESEGLPVSVMEALSFGIPVVATDVGGTREAVLDGHNGYLLKSDFSNTELSEAITKMICMDENEYQQMRENARKTWMKTFSEDRNYRAFVDECFS